MFGGSSQICLDWNELGVVLSRSTWEWFPHVFLLFVCVLYCLIGSFIITCDHVACALARWIICMSCACFGLSYIHHWLHTPQLHMRDSSTLFVITQVTLQSIL